MRFLLYDRLTLLDTGRRVAGVKSFSLTDDDLCGHFARTPVIPGTMLIESMIQLLGWAIIHSHDFQLSAIVCLMEGVRLPSVPLRPGICAEVGGEILSNSASDSLGKTWLNIDGVCIASAERVIFQHFSSVDSEALKRHFVYCGGYSGRAPNSQIDPGKEQRGED
jgi:3-hydroxymyristoyl/3-hydroxydecanoyl-(acyl carrier protein) dehydratase